MTLNENTISKVASVIASKEPDSPNYMKGPELVKFFNSLGFNDSYVFAEGKGIVTPDIGESLSRINYTIGRLSVLNKNDNAFNAIQRFIDISMNPRIALTDINRALNGTTLTFASNRVETPMQVLPISEPKNDKPFVRVNHSDEKIDQGDKYQRTKQELMRELFGDIPSDRVVVFISYSWDSDQHKDWVADLADMLTESGYYVLLDQYNESGIALELFMELGIERADKVLVIGTPLYKLKSLTTSGGAPYEGAIIRNALYQDIGTKKIVPCLKEGSFGQSFPGFIGGRTGFDFSNEANFDSEYKRLCDALINRPSRQRPKLGPNPVYNTPQVLDSNELKYTDFRRDNDVKWLTTLFSNFSIYRMEQYLDSSPEQVEDIVFESHDIWNKIINSMAFKLYQSELRGLVMDFYSIWEEIVKLGLSYYGPSNVPNYFKFWGYTADEFKTPEHAKVFSSICDKMDEMKQKLIKLVDYIKDNYEIDLDALSHKFEQSAL